MRASTEITLEGEGRVGIRERREEIIDGLEGRAVSLSVHYTNDPEGTLYDAGDHGHITVALHAHIEQTKDSDRSFSLSLDYHLTREETELLRNWLDFALEQGFWP